MNAGFGRRNSAARRLALAVLLVNPVLALAGPDGGQIVGGAGSISQITATTTQVQQLSQAMAINWQTFNVGKGETVQFVQPGATSVVLNRVLDDNPSSIFGRIDANGRVFIVNPRGVVFGDTAQVSVGSLMVSGLDMSVDDFMAGRYNVQAVGTPGAVINHGMIAAATGGSVVLAGGQVINTGLIQANYGRVTLAGAESGYVDFDGDGLMRFEVKGELKQKLDGADAAVVNSGVIQAAGGQVVMSAAAAKGVFDQLVNNEGLIQAGAISEEGGVVRLVAVGGDVVNSGVIEASSERAAGGEVHIVATGGNILDTGTIEAKSVDQLGGTVELASNQDTIIANANIDTGSLKAVGGTIEVEGDRVAVTGDSRLGSAGGAGGGNVFIGGGFRGSNPLVRNASQTFVGSDAVLDASAINSGSGGLIVVWSNDYTRFFGTVSARGPPAGHGGFVEVSSHGVLSFDGTFDATAVGGQSGTLLLDPATMDICDNCAQTNLSGTGSSGTPFTTTTPGTASSIKWQTLDAALTGGTVVVQTTAADGINILDSYDFTANHNGTGGQNNAATGTLKLDASGNITAAAGKTVTGRTGLSLYLKAGGTISIDTNFAGFAGLTFENAADSTYTGVISGATAVTKQGAAKLTFSTTQTYTGGTSILNGILALGHATDTLSSTGTVDINGGFLSIGSNSDTVGGVILEGGGHIEGTGGTLTSLSDFDMRSGVVNQTILAGSVGLTKTTSGIISLGSANTYTGTTTIKAGTVSVSADSASGSAGAFGNASSAILLGDTSGSSDATITVNAGGFNIGRDITVQAGNTGIITLSGNNAGGANPTFSGTITFNKAVTLSSTANTTTVFSGVLTDGGGAFAINKAGSGTVRLSNANTYTGGTNVTAGTLSLTNSGAVGTAGTVVVSTGAAVALSGSINVARALTLNSDGISSGGALDSVSGANTWSGAITLAAASRINTDAGTLALTGGVGNGGFPLTVGGAGDTTISTVALSGSGSLTKDGSGKLTLPFANTYTGATTISLGTVVVSVDGALGTNAAGTTLSAGTLDFQNVTYATTEALTVNGGSITASTGTSSFAGGITLGAAGAVDVGGTQLTLSGVIGETGGARTFTKTGTGILVLSNTNSYTGTTTINGGTVVVTANGAFGTAAAGTTLTSGTLDFQNVAYATAEGLTVNGGSITASTGTSSFAGAITLGANGAVDVGGTQLTLGGVISETGGARTLTKTGTGLLILSGANGYTGAVNIQAGTLRASNATALGTIAGGVAITSGATLDIAGVAIGAEAVSLNGNGVGGNGALTSSGTASLAGTVTVAGASRIGGGGTLTLSGAISGGGQTLDLALTGGGITFGNNVTLGGLTTAAASYGVSFTGGTSAIAGATTFNNTGALVLAPTTSLTFSGGLVANDGTQTRSLSGSIITTDNAMTLGAATLTGATSLSAGTGTITLAGVTGGANAFTVTADEIELTGAANSITGSGALILRPTTLNQNIEIAGAGGTGALDLTGTELGTLANGFSGITIGRTADGTGTVTVSANQSFNDNLTLVGGSIASNGTVTSTGNTVTLTARTGAITDGNGGTSNVTASSLTASAVTGIDLDTSITTLTAASVSGAGNLDVNNAGSFTVTSATTANGSVALMATGGTLTVTTATAGTGGAMTLTADEIALGAANTIIGTGALVVQPETTSLGIDIAGAGGTAALDLSATEIAAIKNGFSSITIGRASDGTGAVTVNGAITFNDNVTLVGGSVSVGAGGSTTTTVTGSSSSVTLIARSGNIIDNDGGNGANVTAGTVVLNASGSITNTFDVTGVTDLTLTVGGSLDVRGDNSTVLTDLAVTVDPGTGTNTYNVANFKDLTWGGAVTDTGANINISGISWSVPSTVTPINISITSTTGDINLDDHVSTVGGAAVAINLVAGATPDGGNITVTAQSGNIFDKVVEVVEDDPATVANANLATLSSSTVTLSAAGNKVGDTGTSNDIDVNGTGNINCTGTCHVTSNVSLTSLSLQGDPAQTAGEDINIHITGANGTVDVDETCLTGNSCITANITTSNFALSYEGISGDIYILDTPDATHVAGGITVNGGAFTLTADAGSIFEFSNNSTTKITDTGLITLTAANGIGAANSPIDVAATNLAAHVTTAGGIFLADPNDIVLQAVDTVSGTIAISAGGSILDDASNATSISGSSVSLTAVNAIGATGANNEMDVATTNLTLVAGTNFFVADSADLATLSITGTQSGDANTYSLTATNLTFTATDAGTNYLLTNVTDTTGLNFTFSGDESISIGAISVGTGSVSLTSTAGSIIDNANDSTTDITGGAVTLTAATGIGESAGNGSLDTAATSLDLSVTGAGLINVAESDAVTLAAIDTANGAITITAGGLLTVTNVTSTTDNDANDIALTGAGIAVGVINAGATAGDVTLNAGAGAITDGNGGTLNVTADALSLTSTGAGASLDTSIVSLTASANGALSIREASGLSITSISDAGQTVTLSAGGAVSQTGSITASALELLGGSASWNLSNTGNNIATLAANTGALTYVDADSFQVAVAGATTGITSTGDVFLTAGGNDSTLTVANAISAGGAIGASLTADKMAINADISVGGNSVSLVAESTADANDKIDLGSATDAAANTLELSDAEIDHVHAGSLTIGNPSAGQVTFSAAISPANTSVLNIVTGGSVVDANTTGNDITVPTLAISAGGAVGTGGDPIETDVGSLTLDTSAANGGQFITEANGLTDLSLNAGTGTIALTLTTGSIVDTAADGTDITGGTVTLTLSAAGSIGSGGNPIETSVATLNASTAGAGNIVINQAGALVLGTVSAANGAITVTGDDDVSVGNVSAAGNTITITTPGAIEESGTDGAADLTATTLDLNAGTGIGAAGTIEIAANYISADTTAGAIDLANSGTGDTSNVNVPGGTAVVEVTSLSTAGANITFAQTGGASLLVDSATTTTSGDITLSADNTGSNGGMALLAINAAGSINAQLTTSGGGILVDNLVAGTAISINSVGSIDEVDATQILNSNGFDAAADLTAPTVTLTAADSIGNSSSSQAIETSTANLTASATNDISLTELNGLTDLNLNANGNVFLTLNLGGIADTAADGVDITAVSATITLLDPAAQDVGSSGNHIETDVDNLTVNTSAGGGSQYLTEATGLTTLDLNAGTGDINLVVTTGAVNDSDGLGVVDVVADDLNVTLLDPTAQQFGDSSAFTNYIRTNVNTISVDTSAGGGDQAIFEVNNGWSELNLNAGTGNLVLRVVGSILSSDVGVDLVGTSASITAAGASGGSIGSTNITAGNAIETTVGSLFIDASVADRSIFIRETDGLSEIGLFTNGGSINLHAGGSVLSSDAGVDVSGGPASFEVTSGTFGSTNTAAGNAIQANVSDLTVDTSAGNGDQFIRAPNGLSELSLNAGIGNVALLAVSGSVLSADVGVDIIATSATVNVPSGSFGSTSTAAGNAIETSVDSLSVTTGGGGSQYIRESNGLTNLFASAPSGQVNLLALAGDVTDVDGAVDVIAPTVNIQAPGGSIGSGGNALQTQGVTNLTLAVRNSFYVSGDGATSLTDLAVTVDSSQATADQYALSAFPGLTWELLDCCGAGPNDLTVFNTSATTPINISITNLSADVYLTDVVDTGAAAIKLNAGGNITITASNGNIFDYCPSGVCGSSTNDTPATGYNLSTLSSYTVSLNAPGHSVGTAAADGDIDVHGTGNLAVSAAQSYISSDVPLTSLSLTFDPLNDVVNFQLSGATIVNINEACAATTNVCINAVSNSNSNLDFSLTAVTGDIFLQQFAIDGIGAGNVALTATNGGIFGVAGSRANIATNGTITLSATNGVSSPTDSIGTAAQPLDLMWEILVGAPCGPGVACNFGTQQPIELVLNRTGGGNITISNTFTTADLLLEGFSSVGSGSTSITTDGTIDVLTDLVQSGDVLLGATSFFGSPLSDVVVDAGSTVRSTAGKVTLNAEDDVVLATGTGANPTQVIADTGAVLLSAGVSDVDGQALINIGDFANVTSGATNSSAVTLRSQDIAIDTTGNTNITATGVGGGIQLFTRTGAQQMIIGGTGSTYNLSDAELARFTNYDTLTVGEAGVQSGLITLASVALPVADGAFVVNSNNGAGQIVLNDTGSAALTGTSGAVTLRAGTNGITALATNGTAEIATTGSVTLTSAGTIGTASNRIQFGAGQTGVNITNAPSGAFLGGIGDLTLATVTTGNGSLNVLLPATFTLTAGGPVTLGTGGFTFEADEIDLVGSLTGTGAGVLQPTADNVTIGIGGGAGTLDISDSDIASLGAGFSSITIGRSTSSALITVADATFLSPLTLRSPVGAGGVVDDVSDSVVDLTAPSLTFTVGNGGIGQGVGGSLDTETAALNITSVGGDTSINEATSVAIGTISAAGTTVTLVAGGALTDGNGATTNVTANLLDATAATGIDLDTAINFLVASNSTSGGINIADTAGIAINTVAAAGQTVTLNGGTGAITDNNGPANNITAALLDVTSATGIDLDTTIATLTASNTTSGGINIGDVDGFALNTVSAPGQTVTLSGGTGALSDNNGATTNITATTAALSAATGIGSADALELAVTSVSAQNSTSGNIQLVEPAGNLTVGASGIGVTNAGGGNIVITATVNSLNVLNNIDSGGARTTLTAGDQILAGGGTITANQLVLSAVNGIAAGCSGATCLQTQVGSLQVTNANNGVGIVNTGALTLADISSLGYSISNTNSGLSLQNTGSITVADKVTVGVALNVQANGATSDLTINANITAAPLTLGAGRDILQTAGTTIDGLANGFTLSAGRNVAVAVITTTGSGAITATTGAISDVNGASTNITGGLVSLTAATGIDVDTAINFLTASNTTSGGINVADTNGFALNTVTAAGQTVTLNGGTGAITDNNGAASNVTATLLDVTAATGIDLDATISTLTASNTGSGGINISDGDGFAVNTVSAPAQAVTLAGGGGAITDNNGAATNVTASSLDVSAATGIDLDTAIVSLVASNTTSGGINIADNADIAINTISAPGQTVTLSGGTGAVTDANGAVTNVTANLLDVSATTGIDLDTAINTLTASNTTSGGINIADTSGMAINTVSAAGQTVTLNGGAGAITDNNAAASNIIANLLDVTAATGISLDTTIATLTASNTGSNGIDIADVDGFALNTVSAPGQAVALDGGTGALTDNNAGSLNVTAGSVNFISAQGVGTAADPIDTTVGTISASASTNGGVYIHETDGATLSLITIGNDNDANDVVVTTDTGNLLVGQILIGAPGNGATASDVSLTASAGSIQDDASDLLLDIEGDVITLDGATGVGDIEALELLGNTYNVDGHTGGVGINDLAGAGSSAPLNLTSDGNITYGSNGNIFIGQVISNFGNVTINSFTGYITDDANDVVTDIKGTTVTLNAPLGIGGHVAGAGADQFLEVDSDTLVAQTTDPGSQTAPILLRENSANGTILGTAANPLTTVNSTITIDNPNGGLVIGNVQAPSLVMTAAGDITDGTNGALTVTGNADLTAANITLGNDAGNVTSFGTLTFNSTGTVNITEDDSTTLAGSSTAGTLVLASAAGIDDGAAGDLAVTGNANLSGTSITLGNDAGNDTTFGSLTFSSPGTVNISEDDSMDLAGASNAATLTLTGAGIDDGATGTLNVPGTTTLDAGANNIVLDNANEFGTVAVTAANDVTLNDVSGLDLGSVSMAGNLIAVAANGLTDSNNLDVGGNASFSASSITLDNTDTFGTLTFNSAGSVSIVEADHMDLAGASTAGSLDLTSNGVGGGIDDGATGSVSVNATTLLTAGGNDVILDNTTNDFGGGVTIASANNASLGDANTLQLAGATLTGNLTLDALTSGSQTGPISAAGLELLGGSYVLTVSTNDVDTIAINTTGAVSYLDADDLAVGTVNTVGITTTGQNVTLQTLGAGTIAINDAISLGAGNLTLNSSGAVSQTAAIAAAGLTLFGNGPFVLSDASNDVDTISASTLGAITYVDADDLTVGSVGATGIATGNADVSLTSVGLTLSAPISLGSGNLAIDSSAAVTQNAGNPITALGLALTGAGPFTLTDTANDVTTLAANTSGVITYVDASGVDFGTVGSVVGFSAGSLTLTAGGPVTDSQPVSIGTSTFTVGANDITLDDADDFDNLTVVSAHDVTLNDVDGINLVGISTSGALDVTAAGPIGGGGDIIVGGLTTLAAGSGNNITLTSPGNNFGTVIITSGFDVNLLDANTLDLGPSTISNDLGVTVTAGNLTQSGALDVTGNSTFTLNGAGASLILSDPANSFAGSVTVLPVTGLQDVSIADTSALAVGPLTLSGALTLTADGISQTGTLSVAGVTTLDAGTNDITLTDPANDFNTVVITAAHDANLADVDDIDLGASSVTHDLGVTATQITDSGPITVGNVATFDVGTGTIVLDNAANDFTTVSVTNADSVTLVDADTLDLGTFNVGAGGLNVTVSTGNITNNSGAITVTGPATFTASPGAFITLNHAGNDFSGAVIFGPNGALGGVTVVDQGNFDIGGLDLPGTLTVTADSITDSGTVHVVGLTTFDTTGDITLDSANDDFGTVVVTNANNVTLHDANGITLGNVSTVGNLAVDTTSGDISLQGSQDVGNDLTLTAAGAIDQPSGGVTVGGATTLTAANGSIDMSLSNDFSGLLNASANGGTNHVDINATSNVSLGLLSAPGNVTLVVAGDVTDGNDVPTVSPNIQAASLSLDAHNVGASGDPIEIAMSSSTSPIDFSMSGPSFTGFFVDYLGALNLGTITIAATPGEQFLNLTADSITLDDNFGSTDDDYVLTSRATIVTLSPNFVITGFKLQLNALGKDSLNPANSIGTIQEPIHLQVDPANFSVPSPDLPGFGFISASNFTGQDFSNIFNASNQKMFVIANFTDLIASVQGSFITGVNFTVDASQFKTDLNIFGAEGAGLLLPWGQCDDEESPDCEKKS